MSRPARHLATAVAAVLFVGACGGERDTTAPTTSSPSAAEEPSMDAFDPELSTKPEVTIPRGKPPKQLETEDLVIGTGPKATKTSDVLVHYVGVAWSTREEFDSSWDGGAPVPFSLLRVVPGFQEGIAGMKVGGRRRITMPPDMAYGDRPPPGMKPGETLVFVVDLHGAR